MASGCGGASTASSPATLRLERADLAAVSRALQATAASVDSEVLATKTAWPLVVNGPPSNIAASSIAVIAAAADSSAKVKVPALLAEAQATSLTGPAAEVAGLFGSYATLVARAWKLIGAAIGEIQHGAPASARFARQNIALYIESVYDGHFTLAQLGRKLLDGYRALGGPMAFGTALTQHEVDELAHRFSEATDRLHPHVGVRLGS